VGVNAQANAAARAAMTGNRLPHAASKATEAAAPEATEAATAAPRRIGDTPTHGYEPDVLIIQCRAWRRPMADVAHEASGLASPKPDDIAPQQASRPDSPVAQASRLRLLQPRRPGVRRPAGCGAQCLRLWVRHNWTFAGSDAHRPSKSSFAQLNHLYRPLP
jgi:hypothetical protein